MGKKHTRGISCLALLLTAALLLSGCAGMTERSPQEGRSSGGTAVSSAAAADGVKADGSYITQEELSLIHISPSSYGIPRLQEIFFLQMRENEEAG